MCHFNTYTHGIAAREETTISLCKHSRHLYSESIPQTFFWLVTCTRHCHYQQSPTGRSFDLLQRRSKFLPGHFQKHMENELSIYFSPRLFNVCVISYETFSVTLLTFPCMCCYPWRKEVIKLKFQSAIRGNTSSKYLLVAWGRGRHLTQQLRLLYPTLPSSRSVGKQYPKLAAGIAVEPSNWVSPLAMPYTQKAKHSHQDGGRREVFISKQE